MAPIGTNFKQDLPPPGGYQPINWARIYPKSYFTSYKLFGGFAVVTGVSYYLYALNFKRVRNENLNDNDAKLAIEPVLLAERDREYLKQLRRNRDEETELMKNVPGWKTGTLYGEPVYKTLKENEWFDPIIEEYYAHTNPKNIEKKLYLHFRQ